MALPLTPFISSYCLLLIVTIVLQFSPLVDSIPAKTAVEPDDVAMAESIVLQGLNSDSVVQEPGQRHRFRLALTPLLLQDAVRPRAVPTDTPTLLDLMRSAALAESEAEEESGLLAASGPEAGPFYRKRSFDSISHGSGGFGGMRRGSWGGGSRGDENLTFTFESLFPAIARGLRNIN